MIIISVGCNNGVENSTPSPTVIPTEVPTVTPTPAPVVTATPEPTLNIKSVSLNGKGYVTALHLYEYEKAIIVPYDMPYDVESPNSCFRGTIYKNGYFVSEEKYAIGEETKIYEPASSAYSPTLEEDIYCTVQFKIKKEITTLWVTAVEDNDSYIITYYTYNDIFDPFFEETKNLSATEMVNKYLEKHIVKAVKENVFITYDVD